ncbi:fumarylacetoacetate hydrolase family protein [Salinadaptatus halalkaliphilus]|uniref:Fumarylacetoacetate hydrolase family protein n=1 Tax=Salinadaptatus halalkaliphilus TaxID=2419781 RepID=A0A4S3TIC0_9EURY|nr:fumarylacetoacetate hydrolase family protein [Salinadaptatus halalkaliphilus]THE63691.1 fumarylacetoacetate hydrolase family protein [Salinadaptatus halalkaliphilus]
MKLATIAVETPLGSTRRLCVVDDDYVDVTAGYARLLDDDGEARPETVAKTVAPPNMLEFLRGGQRCLDAARAVAKADFEADAHSPDGARIRYDPTDAHLCSPLPRPNSIRDFSVFEDHGADDKADVWYEFPSPYKGNPDTVVDPDETVAWPAYDDRPDFELEIAAVVGRAGEDIAADEADDYIAGYTIFNDFSAREIQSREMQARLGPAKGKDFANGLGPYLVAGDEFDPTDATATVRVNGDQWVQSEVGDMYHSFGDMLEHASASEGVRPGDVLGSGTVAGCCGYDLDRWIDYGDEIELHVEGLGTLTHQIVAPDE